MNILKNILIIFVTIIFVASSTGVAIVNHLCKCCDTSEIVVNSISQSCCEEKAVCRNIDTQEIESCKYNNNVDDSNCCTEERIFLKLIDQYVPTFNSFNFISILQSTIYILFDYNQVFNTPNTIFTKQSFCLEKISSVSLSAISRLIL